MSQLYIGEGNEVSWRGLRSERTGQYINNAAVIGQLVDASDVDVGDPFILGHINGSDGDYVGTITAATCDELDEGTIYYLVLDATASGYEPAKRRIPYTAMYHRES